jgi:hypothetical protein
VGASALLAVIPTLRLQHETLILQIGGEMLCLKALAFGA